MTYAKPELVLMADARVAIQSNTDGSDGAVHEKELLPDEIGSNALMPTTSAYEADE